MAGDWIKMRCDLQTHPKVVRISSALRADRLRVIGGLHAVWCLFDAHSVDGILDGYNEEALDEMIGFPGFASAMRAVGWLDKNGDSLAAPRFDAHNGQSAKRRAMETDRKREERKASASDADKKRTREEKRRDSKHPSNDGCAPGVPGDEKVDPLPCPKDRIVELYHECLPDNPRLKVWTAAREKLVRTRWRQCREPIGSMFGYSTVEEGVAKWREFFSIVAESDFLTGKAKPQPGKPPFVADLEWLLTSGNFAKTLENKFHREVAE